MTIRITDQQGLALRKHALPTLRKLGVKDGADYLPHKLNWNTLQDHGKEALKSCRAITNSIKDDAPAEEARSIEDAYEGMIEIFDAIENEKNARGILGSREARDSDVNPMRPMPADGETRGEDNGEVYTTRSGWSDKKGAEIRVLTPKQPFATARVEGPSLGDCLRALIAGPRNEAERRALAEGTDSAGGYTVPKPLAMDFIDKLRARSVVMAAGARTVDMTSETLSIARLETDPTFAWRAENSEVTPSDPTFGRVLLEAKSLMGMVKLSRELLEDSVNVSAALEKAFTKGMALEFDRAALYGTGADNQPTGVANVSAINAVSMGTNGAALVSYDSLIDAIYEMQLDNAGDPTAMIYHPRTGVTLAKMKDGEGNPIIVPKMVADVPRLVTTSMPITETQGTASTASSILFGDWTELLIGLRASLRIEVLRERYAEFHQYAFIAYMRGDVQLAHANSFSRLKGIIP